VLWYMSGFRGFKYNSFLAYLLTRIDENTVLKEHGGPIIATHVRYAKAGFAVGFTNQRESEAVDDVVPRFRAKRRDGDFGGRFEMKRAVPGTDRYRLTTDVFKKFWTLAGPLRARGLYVSSSRSVGKVNVSDEEWICYEIVLTAPAAGRARWVEYILHPEEGEVRRRVEADRDSARTLFTWNDYWVEAVLDDGTIIPGDWLSNLIEDREVQGVLRTQAERLTGVPRSLAERPAPNSRRIDRTLEGTLLSEIHAEFQNS
jgi:hypothetical protein